MNKRTTALPIIIFSKSDTGAGATGLSWRGFSCGLVTGARPTNCERESWGSDEKSILTSGATALGAAGFGNSLVPGADGGFSVKMGPTSVTEQRG